MHKRKWQVVEAYESRNQKLDFLEDYHTPMDVVVQVQHFLSKSIMWADISSEHIVIEGIVYVLQKNHQWDDLFTAQVIAMLLGNVAPLIDEPHDAALCKNPF
jgi:predicted nucleic-acid-binding protein